MGQSRAEPYEKEYTALGRLQDDLDRIVRKIGKLDDGPERAYLLDKKEKLLRILTINRAALQRLKEDAARRRSGG